MFLIAEGRSPPPPCDLLAFDDWIMANWQWNKWPKFWTIRGIRGTHQPNPRRKPSASAAAGEEQLINNPTRLTHPQEMRCKSGISTKFGTFLFAGALAFFVADLANGLEQEFEYSSNLGSIATGSGRIFRPARALTLEEEMPLDNQQQQPQMDVGDAPMLKRSMSLGRLAFRPGKRRFLPISGAFAHDPLNRRYELLFMDDHSEGTNVAEEGLKGQPKLISHLRFRLLPGMIDSDDGEEGIPSAIAEASMGKRSSLASGRIGFRPAKRSMAVGRTGFRPGKRSIATGRVRFRPGKRSLLSQNLNDDDDLFLISS